MEPVFDGGDKGVGVIEVIEHGNAGDDLRLLIKIVGPCSFWRKELAYDLGASAPCGFVHIPEGWFKAYSFPVAWIHAQQGAIIAAYIYNHRVFAGREWDLGNSIIHNIFEGLDHAFVGARAVVIVFVEMVPVYGVL